MTQEIQLLRAEFFYFMWFTPKLSTQRTEEKSPDTQFPMTEIQSALKLLGQAMEANATHGLSE